MIAALFAEDPSGQQSPPFFLNPLFLVVLVVLYVVLVVLPSGRRQRKEQQALLAGLKRGAKVLTSGGIIGTVVGVKDGDDEIVIRSEDTKLRVKRNTVVQVIGSDESEAAK
ncbi:MAG: preprotein translocase subunit YajC [Gemmataceae bacterium]|nr:preprotein translocase subunit YajC [Gemmataceae bacterium]